MKLLYRPTEDWDLAECLRLVQPAAAGIPSASAMMDLWQGLRKRGAFNSAVMEDQERPQGRRLVHFGASVFVHDAFLQAVRAKPSACHANEILERTLAGRCPALDAAAIRRDNAGGGLNVFVLHSALSADLLPEERQAVVARAPETFFLVHQGFHLKQVMLQMPDLTDQQLACAAGFHLRDPGTGLLGLTRDEAAAVPGTYAARLFTCERPVLQFRPRDQQLLQRALLGETDAEIAEVLGLSPDTIKVRWRAIYERVAERAPELLPEETRETKRGVEKRRHLLHYLRHHLEELRPQPKDP